MKKDDNNKFNPEKIFSTIAQVEKEYNKIDEWFIPRDRHSFYLTHDFHPYFAAFPPELVVRLLEKYSKQNDVFLDPFMGGGSSIVEGYKLKRKTIGIDISFFAKFVSKTKTNPIKIDEDKISKLFRDIEEDIANNRKTKYDNYKYNLPNIKNIDKWFSSESKFDLGIIRHHINMASDIDFRDFLLLGFSSIIRKASNAKNAQQHISIKKGKKIPEAYPLFQEKINLMCKQMKEYVEILGDLNQYSEPKLYVYDVRKMDEIIEPDSIDIIITSPPYGTGSKYTEVYRLNFEWLEVDKPIRKETMENSKNFKFELEVALAKMYKVLKKNKYCFIVYGDPSTDDSLTRVAIKDAIKVGFKYEGLISCPIEKILTNHHEKYRRFIPKDYILIFKK